MNNEKVACKNCGKLYPIVSFWQRFCTPKCRDAWHYKDRKDALRGAEVKKYPNVPPEDDRDIEFRN